MCSGCARVWSFLHVTWSILYVSCGAAQLVAGIFFLLAIPSFVLGCSLVAGLWNIFMGIGIGMVACCGRISPRRQESLLYMVISVLIINTVNAIISEWGFFHEDLPQMLRKHQYNVLLNYASFATRVATAAVILISFADSQLTFCSMQTTRSSLNTKNKKKKSKNPRGSHEQVSDIEYIIPRAKTSKPQVYNAYTQSWVFDADVGGSGSAFPKHHHQQQKSPAEASRAYHLKLPNRQDVIITPRPASHHYHLQQHQHLQQKGPLKAGDHLENGVIVIADTTYLIDAGDAPIVRVEQVVVDADADSDSTSDRKLPFMKSFSRSPSPAVLSATSSQLSLDHINNHHTTIQPAIYDCLERLTQPETFRTRLNSARSNREQDEEAQEVSDLEGLSVEVVGREVLGREAVEVTSGPRKATMVRRGDSISPQPQYASLMKELQSAIDKKETSCEQGTIKKSSRGEEGKNSNNSNSDADFSKELEAALQLIQDLESPPPKDTDSISRSDSEKTISAHVVGGRSPPLPPLHVVGQRQSEQPQDFKAANGKGARTVVVQSSDSQSTSGYSSPTHHHHHFSHDNVNKNNATRLSLTDLQCTTTTNNNNNTLAYTIHNTKSTAVISLFTPPTDALKKGKSITLVNITGDNQPVIETKEQVPHHDDVPPEIDHSIIDNKSIIGKSASPATSSVSSWNVKSLLRRKSKRLSSTGSSVPPIQLCPELEGAIVKSESLAYLTELELMARHQRNANIQRQIEQKVQQQLGTPWIDELNGGHI